MKAFQFFVAALLCFGLATSVQADDGIPGTEERVYDIEGFGNASETVIDDDFDLGEVVSIKSISVTIAHSWLSDLELELTAPDGDVYTPFFDADGGDDLGDGGGFGLGNTVKYVFLHPGTIGTTLGGGVGNPRPGGSYDAETWGDGSPAGTWNINLVDDASGDTGSIGSIIINYNTVPEPGFGLMALLGMIGVPLLRRRS